MNREEKVAIVKELNGKFAEAKVAIVADYRGLTVPDLLELRRNLKKGDAEFRVAKNTLLRRAVEGTGFEGLQDHFTGTSAIAVSNDDPVSPAKVLYEFCKTHPALEIRTALLDGKILSHDEIEALSKLPDRDTLLAKLLSVMNGVPTSFVQVLSGVPRTFLYTLQAIKDQKEQKDN